MTERQHDTVRFTDHRRKTPRFPYHAEVEIKSDPPVRGVSLDVSAGGMRLSVDKDLKVGAVCDVVIRAPRSISRDKVKVVWQEPGQEANLVGLEFL